MMINYYSEEICEVLGTIEQLKEKLIESGNLKGLNDPDTLNISVELDNYIVKYQKLVAHHPPK